MDSITCRVETHLNSIGREAGEAGSSASSNCLGSSSSSSVLSSSADGSKQPLPFDSLLLDLGLPQDFVDAYKSPNLVLDPFPSLYDWQHDCIRVHGRSSRNLIISAPTSSGKTLVAELLMLLALCRAEERDPLATGSTVCPLAIFVMPLVSIADEKAKSLSKKLCQVKFGRKGKPLNCVSIAGGSRASIKKAHIVVATIEKALLVLRKLIDKGNFFRIAAVIVDECHMVGDGSRGFALETLLCMTRYLQKKGSKARIIAMSATIPNSKHMSSWLGADRFVTDFRPRECKLLLKFGTNRQDGGIHKDLARDKRLKLRSLYLLTRFDSNAKLPAAERVLPVETNNLSIGGRHDADHIPYLCLETVRKGGKVIVFCPTKNDCVKMCGLIKHVFEYAINSNGLCDPMVASRSQNDGGSPAASRIKETRRLQMSLVEHANSRMMKAVRTGVAYHHSGVPKAARSVIEDLFATPDGLINVICATTTLAQGVNLPVTRVIIRSQYTWKQSELLKSSTIRQMWGRAGRPGYCGAGIVEPDCIIIVQCRLDVKLPVSLMERVTKLCRGSHANVLSSVVVPKLNLEYIVSMICIGAVISLPKITKLVQPGALPHGDQNETTLAGISEFIASSFAVVNARYDKNIRHALLTGLAKGEAYIRSNSLLMWYKDAEDALKFKPSSNAEGVFSSGLQPSEMLLSLAEIDRLGRKIKLTDCFVLMYLSTPPQYCVPFGISPRKTADAICTFCPKEALCHILGADWDLRTLQVLLRSKSRSLELQCTIQDLEYRQKIADEFLSTGACAHETNKHCSLWETVSSKICKLDDGSSSRAFSHFVVYRLAAAAMLWMACKLSFSERAISIKFGTKSFRLNSLVSDASLYVSQLQIVCKLNRQLNETGTLESLLRCVSKKYFSEIKAGVQRQSLYGDLFRLPQMNHQLASALVSYGIEELDTVKKVAQAQFRSVFEAMREGLGWGQRTERRAVADRALALQKTAQLIFSLDAGESSSSMDIQSHVNLESFDSDKDSNIDSDTEDEDECDSSQCLGTYRMAKPNAIIGRHYLPNDDCRATLRLLPEHQVHNFLKKCEQDGFSFSTQLRALDTRRLKAARWAEVALRRHKRWYIPSGIALTLKKTHNNGQDQRHTTIFIPFIFPLPDPEFTYFERAGMKELFNLRRELESQRYGQDPSSSVHREHISLATVWEKMEMEHCSCSRQNRVVSAKRRKRHEERLLGSESYTDSFSQLSLRDTLTILKYVGLRSADDFEQNMSVCCRWYVLYAVAYAQARSASYIKPLKRLFQGHSIQGVGLSGEIEALTKAGCFLNPKLLADPVREGKIILNHTYNIGMFEEETVGLNDLEQCLESDKATKFSFGSSVEFSCECAEYIHEVRDKVVSCLSNLKEKSAARYMKCLKPRINLQTKLEPVFASIRENGIQVNKGRLFKMQFAVSDRMRYIHWRLKQEVSSMVYSQTSVIHSAHSNKSLRSSFELGSYVHSMQSMPNVSDIGFASATGKAQSGSSKSVTISMSARGIVDIMQKLFGASPPRTVENKEKSATFWSNDALRRFAETHNETRVIQLIVEYRELSLLKGAMDRIPAGTKKRGSQRNTLGLRFRLSDITSEHKNGRITISDGLQVLPKSKLISLPLRRSFQEMLEIFESISRHCDAHQRKMPSHASVGLPAPGGLCWVVLPSQHLNGETKMLIGTFHGKIDTRRKVSAPITSRLGTEGKYEEAEREEGEKEGEEISSDVSSLAAYWNRKSGTILYDEATANRVVQVDILLNISSQNSRKVYSWPADMVYPMTDKGYTLGNQKESMAPVVSTDRKYWCPWNSPLQVSLRRAFTVGRGNVLVAVDYSQIEMRVAAHFSGSSKFRNIFEGKLDPFSAMTSIIFQPSSTNSRIYAENRDLVKRMAYGWLYGQSNVSWRETFKKAFPDARQYHDSVREELNSIGGVISLAGNFRKCDSLTKAYNSKAQGSAADLFKVAIDACYQRLREQVPTAQIVLLVHDEIVVEVPRSEALLSSDIVTEEMIRAGKILNLKVPLAVKASVGESYDKLESADVWRTRKGTKSVRGL